MDHIRTFSVPITGVFAGLGDAGMVAPSFAEPAWLLMVPLLWYATWRMGRGGLSSFTTGQWVFRCLVRCVVLALLCGALAQPSFRWRAENVAVIAVLDVSDSVPSSERQRMIDFLTASLGRRTGQDRFALVTTARDALVQSLPTAAIGYAEIHTTGPTDGTDLHAGLQLGRALIPSDTAARIILLSDGNETSGSISSAADMLAASGIPLDVVVAEYDRSSMVRIDKVVVPPWARDGDTVSVRVVISAGAPQRGRLSLLVNGEPLDLDPATDLYSAAVVLDQPVTVLSLPVRLPRGPVHVVEAEFLPEIPENHVPQLLADKGVTFTHGPARVLMVAETEEETAAFRGAISEAVPQIDIRQVRGSAAPVSMMEWSSFDAVVLFNQPASNFSLQQMTSIADAVHDAGVGLLVVGGPESFGAGGWIGSPLEDVLPVRLDPPQKRRMPMGALALVIDRSGSMSQMVAGTGSTQQQLANESAILAINSLSRLDNVVVVAFDDSPTVVVPLRRRDDPTEIARMVRTIGPGGGTNLFPALVASGEELSKSPGGVKHIIILTDGQTVGSPQEGIEIARDLARRGVSISAVSVGDSANENLLSHIAHAAGGRAYLVRSNQAKAALPQIFVKEAQTVRRSLIWEGPAFTPTLSAPAESMKGIGVPLPGITGYIVTADRGGLSTVALRGPENDPILAQWQHGLGRVTAFTSDSAGRWNAAWTPWTGFSQFWEQQLIWTMRPSGDATSRISIDYVGDTARITAELFDPDGERVNFAQMSGRLAAPMGNTDSPVIDVPFRQAGPGRYIAEVPFSDGEPRLFTIRYAAGRPDGSVRSGVIRTALSRRGGDELRGLTPSTAVMWDAARKTSGRIYHASAEGENLWSRDHLSMPIISRAGWMIAAFIALGLFLLDVAARRVLFDPNKLREHAAAALAAAPRVQPAHLGALSRAKVRAGVGRRELGAGERPRDVPSEAAGAQESQRVLLEQLALRAKSESEQQTRAPGAQPPQSTTRTPPPGAAIDAPPADTMSRLRAAKRRSQDQDPRAE